MKIAVIAPSPIPARTANSIQVMKMTQAIASLGHHAVLLAPYKSKSPVNFHSKSATPVDVNSDEWQRLAHHYGIQERFTIVRLPATSYLRRYDYALRALFWARSWQADLIYTRLPQAASFASLIAMNTILEMHDLPNGFLGIKLFRLYLKGRGARRLVVISRALAEDLAFQFGNNILLPTTIIVSDGVDLARYAHIVDPMTSRIMLLNNSLVDKQFPTDRFTAGYTGHLYKGRGIHLILKIAGMLPEVSFLLAGGEPEQVLQLRREIKIHGLDNVYTVGFVPNADLPRFQAACDILMMPYQERISASSGGDISRYLSPMKLFEYMACGRPILSSDIPVLRETLTEKNAVFLPPNVAAAWVSEIQDLLSDKDKRERLSHQARHDVQQYKWEARAVKILEGL